MDSLKRLWPYVKPYRKTMVLTMVLGALSGALGGIFLVLAKNVLEPILDIDVRPAERFSKLNWMTVIIVAAALLRIFVDFGDTYLAQRTGQRVLARIRRDLFAHLQLLSVGYFERKRTGELMSRLTNDLNALQNVLTQAVDTIVSAPFEVVGGLAYMLYYNWRLTIFVIILLPPIAYLINRAGRSIRAAVKSLQMQLAELTNYLQEKISAMRLIQTFGTRDYEVDLFEKANQEAYRRTMTPIRIQAALAPVIEFTGMMGVVACIWFGTHQVHTKTDAAALMIFLLAMHRVAMRAKSLAGLSLILKSADAAASRLWEVLDTVPEVRDRPGATDLTTKDVKGHLRFEGVRFGYSPEKEVLHGISFEIKPGQSIALAGRSGSGKSTIAALVPRLYDPKAGAVLIDGVDLRDVTMNSLRAHIGTVPQETTLFHGSVRDNIAYGRPNATLEQITEAARRAYADDFVRAMPEGYDTQIGERGTKLSGGQRQRIAIARALLRDPKILILDEATSSLDAESEHAVQAALETLMAGRTTLIIAHRFSTIQRADHILVLGEGNVIEQGTHEGLLKARGEYWNLYQRQAFEVRRAENERLAEGEWGEGDLEGTQDNLLTLPLGGVAATGVTGTARP